ncbi:hypothetical protein C3L33_09856, partial [Rhododendron williamsianum]
SRASDYSSFFCDENIPTHLNPSLEEEEDMSKLWKRIAGLLGNRAMAGVDKAGNRYFARTEQMDGVILKKEEEERRSKEGIRPRATSTGKVGGPDLRSFIQQFPADSKGDTVGETSGAMDGMRNSEESETDKEVPSERKRQPESSEPTGTGASFRPGTWQPPT